jgi:hypothetical protein
MILLPLLIFSVLGQFFVLQGLQTTAISNTLHVSEQKLIISGGGRAFKSTKSVVDRDSYDVAGSKHLIFTNWTSTPLRIASEIPPKITIYINGESVFDSMATCYPSGQPSAEISERAYYYGPNGMIFKFSYNCISVRSFLSSRANRLEDIPE